MKQNISHKTLPAMLVVVMMTFFSIIFLTDANPAFAASRHKKTAAVATASSVERTESRIKQLRAILKISDAQEPLWNDLTVVMRENAKDMDALRLYRSDNSKTKNAVEHMKFHSQKTEAQLNQLKKLIPPFEALYISMSDEQKKSTDTIFRTGRHGKKRIK